MLCFGRLISFVNNNAQNDFSDEGNELSVFWGFGLCIIFEFLEFLIWAALCKNAFVYIMEDMHI